MAGDCFLKIDGIPGESTDDKHKDWIEVMSYSHGVSQMAGGEDDATIRTFPSLRRWIRPHPRLICFAAKASTLRRWISNFAAQPVTKKNAWNIKWRM